MSREDAKTFFEEKIRLLLRPRERCPTTAKPSSSSFECQRNEVNFHHSFSTAPPSRKGSVTIVTGGTEAKNPQRERTTKISSDSIIRSHNHNEDDEDNNSSSIRFSSSPWSALRDRVVAGTHHVTKKGPHLGKGKEFTTSLMKRSGGTQDSPEQQEEEEEGIEDRRKKEKRSKKQKNSPRVEIPRLQCNEDDDADWFIRYDEIARKRYENKMDMMKTEMQEREREEDGGRERERKAKKKKTKDVLDPPQGSQEAPPDEPSHHLCYSHERATKPMTKTKPHGKEKEKTQPHEANTPPRYYYALPLSSIRMPLTALSSCEVKESVNKKGKGRKEKENLQRMNTSSTGRSSSSTSSSSEDYSTYYFATPRGESCPLNSRRLPNVLCNGRDGGAAGRFFSREPPSPEDTMETQGSRKRKKYPHHSNVHQTHSSFVSSSLFSSSSSFSFPLPPSSSASRSFLLQDSGERFYNTFYNTDYATVFSPYAKQDGYGTPGGRGGAAASASSSPPPFPTPSPSHLFLSKSSLPSRKKRASISLDKAKKKNQKAKKMREKKRRELPEMEEEKEDSPFCTASFSTLSSSSSLSTTSSGLVEILQLSVSRRTGSSMVKGLRAVVEQQEGREEEEQQQGRKKRRGGKAKNILDESDSEKEEAAQGVRAEEGRQPWQLLGPYVTGTCIASSRSDKGRLMDVVKQRRVWKKEEGEEESKRKGRDGEGGGGGDDENNDELARLEGSGRLDENRKCVLTKEQDEERRKKREAEELEKRCVKDREGGKKRWPHVSSYRLEHQMLETENFPFPTYTWSPFPSLPPFLLPHPFFGALPTSFLPSLSPFSLPVVEAVSVAAMRRDAAIQSFEVIHVVVGATSPWDACPLSSSCGGSMTDTKLLGPTTTIPRGVARTPAGGGVPLPHSFHPTEATALEGGITQPERRSRRGSSARKGKGAVSGALHPAQKEGLLLFGGAPTVLCHDVVLPPSFPTSSPATFPRQSQDHTLNNSTFRSPSSPYDPRHPPTRPSLLHPDEKGGGRGRREMILWPPTVQLSHRPSFSPCRYFVALTPYVYGDSGLQKRPGLLPMLHYDSPLFPQESQRWKKEEKEGGGHMVDSPLSHHPRNLGEQKEDKPHARDEYPPFSPYSVHPVLVPEKFIFSHGRFIEFTAAILLSRFYRIYQFRHILLEEEARKGGAHFSSPSSLLVPPLFASSFVPPYSSLSFTEEGKTEAVLPGQGGKVAGGGGQWMTRRTPPFASQYRAMEELEKLLQWSIQDAMRSRYPEQGITAASSSACFPFERGGEERTSTISRVEELLSIQLYDCDNIACFPGRFLHEQATGTFQDHVKRCMEDAVIPPSPEEQFRRQQLQAAEEEEEKEYPHCSTRSRSRREKEKRKEEKNLTTDPAPSLRKPSMTALARSSSETGASPHTTSCEKRGGRKRRIPHWKWWRCHCPLFLGASPPLPPGGAGEEGGGEPFMFTSSSSNHCQQQQQHDIQILREEASSLSYAYYHAAQQYDVAGGEGSMVYSVLNGLLPEIALYDSHLMLQKLRLALQYSYRHPFLQDNYASLLGKALPSSAPARAAPAQGGRGGKSSFRSSAWESSVIKPHCISLPETSIERTAGVAPSTLTSTNHTKMAATSSSSGMAGAGPPACSIATLYSVALMLFEFFPGRDYKELEILCRAVVQDCLALGTLVYRDEEVVESSKEEGEAGAGGRPTISNEASARRGGGGAMRNDVLHDNQMEFIYEVARAMMTVIVEQDSIRRYQSMVCGTPHPVQNSGRDDGGRAQPSRSGNRDASASSSRVPPPPPSFQWEAAALALLTSTTVPVAALFGYHEAFFDVLSQTWGRSHLVEATRALYTAGLYQYTSDMQHAILRAGRMKYHQIPPDQLAVEPQIRDRGDGEGGGGKSSRSRNGRGSDKSAFFSIGSSPGRTMLRLGRRKGNWQVRSTGLGSVQGVVESIHNEDPLKPMEEIQGYVLHLLALYFRDFAFPSHHPFLRGMRTGKQGCPPSAAPPPPSTAAPPPTALSSTPPPPLGTSQSLASVPVMVDAHFSPSPPPPLLPLPPPYSPPPRNLRDILSLPWFHGVPGRRWADAVYVDLYALATYCPVVFSRRLVYYSEGKRGEEEERGVVVGQGGWQEET